MLSGLTPSGLDELLLTCLRKERRELPEDEIGRLSHLRFATSYHERRASLDRLELAGLVLHKERDDNDPHAPLFRQKIRVYQAVPGGSA
jgi:hypothetical protein